jgi:hypothetical protein
MIGHDDPDLLCALWLPGEVDHGVEWQPTGIAPDDRIERQWRAATGERLTLFRPSRHAPADLLDADRATLLAGGELQPTPGSPGTVTFASATTTERITITAIGGPDGTRRLTLQR